MSRLSVRTRAAGFAAALILLTQGSAAFAITIKNAGYDYYHRKLANDNWYEPVGQLTLYTANDNGVLSPAGTCSGTLIRPGWVLTAAHCVDFIDDATFEVGGRLYSADRWYTPYKWRREYWKGNDIALVKLTSNVTNVRPAATRRARYEYTKKAVSVGFGRTGTAVSGGVISDGVKRAARNRLDVLDGVTRRQITYDFDMSPTDPDYFGGFHDDFDWGEEDFPMSLEGGFAQGDSGGAVFIRNQVAGIHSWGIGVATDDGVILGIGGGLNYSTRVSAWWRWINQVIRRVHQDRNPRAREASFLNPIFGDEGPEEDFDGQFLAEYLANGYRPTNALAAVPEPTTALLAAAGALTLLTRRRR